MSTNNTNSSIGCNVSECRFHDTSDYCTLSQIEVVKNKKVEDIETIEATDCGSYEIKD